LKKFSFSRSRLSLAQSEKR